MIEATYIDHMGDDLTIVNSARVSFGKKSDWLQRVYSGEAQLLPNKDIKLIHYLAKHNHKSPFNHVFTTFHVKAPIFVARQLQKHEYMPWNEISRRYVDSEPEFYEPVVWRGRSEDKKQGSYGIVDLKTKPTHQYALQTYHNLLSDGVAPEQARMVLPQNMYTEWYWSGSLYAFSKMCSLRLKEDTQLETREIAQQISSVMKDLFPFSWKALGETNVT